ncbi:hypothetical protein RB595_007666 [Gaeumannomyces hyphopodioides]
MRVSILTAALAASPALAHPGMKSILSEIKARAAETLESNELIGDLITLNSSALTPVGRSIKELLTRGGTPESDEAYPKDASGNFQLPGKDTPACAADTCCIWKYLADDLVKEFRDSAGRCTDSARGAVRLGFHDAAGWSKGTGGGGADGSLILAPEEILRGENNGLQEVVAQTKQRYDAYKKYGVGMADFIQFSATVATVACPLGPRIRTYVGRKDSTIPAPDNLLPSVTDSADFLIGLFENKTIKPHGLTALIGAHSTSRQRFVDPSRAGDSQDSTPGVWDVAFYKETLGAASARIFRFASDIALAKDRRVSSQFNAFAGPGGQLGWNSDYAREYIRLSLLGVFNINDLTECTKSLPPHVTTFVSPGQGVVGK